MTDLDFSEIFVHYGISLVSESSLEFLVLAFGLASGKPCSLILRIILAGWSPILFISEPF